MGKRGKRQRHQRRAEERRQKKGLEMHAGYDSDRDWHGPTLWRPNNDCHKKVTKVWEKGSLRIWCGDRASVGFSTNKFNLYISAAGLTCRINPPVFLTTGAATLLGYNPQFDDIGDMPHLFIECSDGCAPPLDAQHWVSIADKLLEFTTSEHPFDVVVFCEGGHGRTGTVAAVLLYFLGAFDSEAKPMDPAWWLRNRYCMEAVETYNQAEYITNMTGMEVKVAPSLEAIPNTWGAGIDTSGTGNGYAKPAGGATNAADPKNTYEEVYVRDNDVLWRLTVNKAGDILYREAITQPGAGSEGAPRARKGHEAVYASWLGPEYVNERARWILAGKPDREAWAQHRDNSNRPAAALTDQDNGAGSRPWLSWLPVAVRGVTKQLNQKAAEDGTAPAPLPPGRDVESH